MNFSDAISLFTNGKKIRRKSWSEYCYIDYDRENRSEIFLFTPDRFPFGYPSSIVYSEGWQIVGEDKSCLLEFSKAIQRVITERAKAKLEEWNDDTWIEVDEEEKTIFIRKMRKDHFNFDLDSMKANDWEILGE